MLRNSMLLFTAFASILPSIAMAQDYYVQTGSPVMLMTRTDLSTRDNRPGDKFYLTVAENVSAKGQIVIPVGAMAVGEIVRSDRNGHFGKSGKISVRVLYIDTPTQRIALTGDHNAKGKSGTLPVIATALFASVIGSIFIHGTSGRIRSGTPVQAYLAEDLRFALNDQQSEQEARNYAPATSGFAQNLRPNFETTRNNR